MRKKWEPMTPARLRELAKLWRSMHACGTPKQVASAEEQARRNERLAAERQGKP